MDERARLLSEVALVSSDYRTFLTGAFEAIGSTQKRGKFSHAAFARRAGFKSRGFSQEVVSGRKRITVTSFPKFERALQLPRLPNAIFRGLVRIEEPEFNERGTARDVIARELEELRGRLRNELAMEAGSEEVSKKLFGHRHVLSVYAVLGNREKGSSFEDIVRRTGLQPAMCRRVLDQLLSQRLVRAEADRYFSINPHLVFQGLGGDHPVKAAYLETLGDLHRSASEDFSNPEKVFVNSYFSVDPKRLPELKKRLWSVTLDFIDEFDHDDGERVGKLVVGFFTNSPS